MNSMTFATLIMSIIFLAGTTLWVRTAVRETQRALARKRG